jgi:DNA-binding transcriptional ArsR family regulator
MKDRNCIRVLADENQISQCKQDLSAIEGKIERMAALLSLAGNSVRLKILFLLHQEEQMCPCDLSDVLEMTVPAISQHLRKLKDGGVIKNKKVGQTIFYSIVKENVQDILPLIAGLASSEKKDVVKIK